MGPWCLLAVGCLSCIPCDPATRATWVALRTPTDPFIIADSSLTHQPSCESFVRCSPIAPSFPTSFELAQGAPGVGSRHPVVRHPSSVIQIPTVVIPSSPWPLLCRFRAPPLCHSPLSLAGCLLVTASRPCRSGLPPCHRCRRCRCHG